VLANLSQPLPDDNPVNQGPGLARTIPIVGGRFIFAGQPAEIRGTAT
jgi:hypothetical protein